MIPTERSSELAAFARKLRLATIGLIGVLVTATAAALLIGDRMGPVTTELADPDLGRAAVPVALLIVALVVFALAELCRMLLSVEAGDLFSPGPIRHFRRFAIGLFAASIAGVAAPWIAGLGVAVSGEADTVTMTMDAADGLLILLSVLLLLIARLLEAAAVYKEDSGSFL